MEIGSEFWLDGNYKEIHNIAHTADTVCVLSGRTALDLIIRDISACGKIESVYLPSYCCESMIEPFIRNNVKVRFYRVKENGIEYDEKNNCDAVLLIDFFGYSRSENAAIAQTEYKNGKTVIYDSTHKLNGSVSVRNYTSYSFCSYRKWFYCNFAKIEKYSGSFDVPVPEKTNEKYISVRNSAACLKAGYMRSENDEKIKNDFLALYSSAEERLENDYTGYAGIPVETDIDSIINKRKENAGQLIEQLKEIRGIRLMNNNVKSDDCPMFVPILTDAELRDGLRKYLIENKIYCPIHWPISALHGEYKDIYYNELSLICDQRYSAEDMDREISCITDFIVKYR